MYKSLVWYQFITLIFYFYPNHFGIGAVHFPNTRQNPDHNVYGFWQFSIGCHILPSWNALTVTPTSMAFN